jgi:hypothetical protein
MQRFSGDDPGPAELWLLKVIMENHAWVLDDVTKVAVDPLLQYPPVFDALTIRSIAGGKWKCMKDLATAAHGKVLLSWKPSMWFYHVHSL